MKLIDRLKSAFTPFIGMQIDESLARDLKAAYADALRDHVMQEGVFSFTDANALVVNIPDVIAAEFGTTKVDLNV